MADINPGSRKAAIIILTMGEELAAEVLKEMDGGTIKEVFSCLQEMSRVSEDEVGRAVEEFKRGMEMLSLPSGAQGTAFFRDALERALGGDEADRIEKELCTIIPEPRWSRATLLLGTHGRRICNAKRPDCAGCPIRTMCDHVAG